MDADAETTIIQTGDEVEPYKTPSACCLVQCTTVFVKLPEP
jgi:hypothetical protein